MPRCCCNRACDALEAKFELMGTGARLQEYLSVVGFDEWTRIEGRYRATAADTE